jgi:hypothetical protein
MSTRNWKRFCIASFTVLASILIGFILLSGRQRAELALSLSSYRTNSDSNIFATVIVRNQGTRTVEFAIGIGATWPPDSYPLTNGPFTLPPDKQTMINVPMPSEKARRVVAGAMKDYSDLFGKMRRYFDRYVTERGWLDFYTLELPTNQ